MKPDEYCSFRLLCTRRERQSAFDAVWQPAEAFKAERKLSQYGCSRACQKNHFVMWCDGNDDRADGVSSVA